MIENPPAESPRLKPLTAKEARFALLYVFDPHTKGNATQSAIKAGYSVKSANTTGPRTLKKPHIALRVEGHTAELAESSKASADNIIERYRLIAMSDAVELLVFDPDETYVDGEGVERVRVGRWRFKTPDELTPGQRAMVADVTLHNKLDRATGEVIAQAFRYKTHNVKDSLDSLARTQGMFRDRVEHEHSHRVRALFEFVAKVPERSETVAMLDAKHGRGTTIEGEATEIPTERPKS